MTGTAAAPMGFGQALGALFMTVFVCALAYATTRFLSGRLGGTGGSTGGNLWPARRDGDAKRAKGAKGARVVGQLFGFSRPARRTGRLEIIERLTVGKDRQILILRVGDREYLAGVGADGVRFGPEIDAPSEPDAMTDGNDQ